MLGPRAVGSLHHLINGLTGSGVSDSRVEGAATRAPTRTGGSRALSAFSLLARTSSEDTQRDAIRLHARVAVLVWSSRVINNYR